LADGDVKADIKLPETWSLGISHQLNPKVELLADYTWTGWDSIRDLDIKRSSGPLSGQTLASTPLHFKNTWRVGFGGNYQMNDAWKLRAGIAYDNGNTSDEFRTPRLPDSDRVWFALGAQWKVAPATVIDFGYSYIHVKDTTSQLRNQETPTSTPHGSLVGDYEADAHVLGAQVRWNF
jgi:long-chain fatty acid transport protein